MNKSSLARVLSEAWSTMTQSFLKQGQQMVLAGAFRGGQTAEVITSQGAENIEALFSLHEEADPRILLHANNALAHVS